MRSADLDDEGLLDEEATDLLPGTTFAEDPGEVFDESDPIIEAITRNCLDQTGKTPAELLGRRFNPRSDQRALNIAIDAYSAERAEIEKAEAAQLAKQSAKRQRLDQRGERRKGARITELYRLIDETEGVDLIDLRDRVAASLESLDVSRREGRQPVAIRFRATPATVRTLLAILDKLA